MTYEDPAAIRDATVWAFPKRVIAAGRVGDLVIALLDPDEDQREWGQRRNLQAFSRTGELMWTGDLPTTTTGDSYYRIRSFVPLIALSQSSYACTIDSATGKITKKAFLK